MTRTFPVFLLASFVAPAAALAQDPQAALRRTVQRELSGSHGASGAVVAVVAGDGAMRVEAFGEVESESSEVIRPELLFGTAGLDGVLVALAAAVLHADGRLDLHAPVRTYIPDLPPRLGAVTLAQLLSHTAGLDDADDETPLRRPVSKVWPPATDRALFTEPDAIYSPSRYGARLARAVLEVIAGKPVPELVDELILSPAGMRRSTFDGRRAQELGATPGHVLSTSIDRPLVALKPSENPYPQFFTTAGDLARLMSALLNDGMLDGQQVLPPDAVAQSTMTRAARPAAHGDSVALGWAIVRFLGHRQVAYSGGVAGYGVTARLVPEARAAVVVLANGTGAVLNTAADTALAQVLRATAAHPDPPAPAAPAPPDPPGMPQDLAGFAGTYANGDRIIVLELGAGQLVWVDGDLVLPVRRQGPLFQVLVADGRVAQVFRWTEDAAGRDYLLVRDRAFRRADAAR